MRDPHAVRGKTGFVVNVVNGLYSPKGDICIVYSLVYSLDRTDVDSPRQRGSSDLKSMVHMPTWTTNPTGAKAVGHVGN